MTAAPTPAAIASTGVPLDFLAVAADVVVVVIRGGGDVAGRVGGGDTGRAA